MHHVTCFVWKKNMVRDPKKFPTMTKSFPSFGPSARGGIPDALKTLQPELPV